MITPHNDNKVREKIVSNGVKVDAALKIILKSIQPLDSEVVKLNSASSRVLAQDIHADSNIPRFDNSAMDGYAVKSEDTVGASRARPKTLEVIADLKAGYVIKEILKKNQAIRIMTGAPVPKGADSVVMVEDTKTNSHQSGKESVEIHKQVKSGENVRTAGEDIKRGKLVFSRGLQLRPAHIGILASLGLTGVKVARKPYVAVLATGDEVVEVGRRLGPGKIRSSNSYTLLNQVSECGGIPKNLGIAGDNLRELKGKIRAGLGCDMLITSGGVSVGDYDLVKDALVQLGTNIHFWKVAMRPGKPLVFGAVKGIPVFGLPGNPVSSMVSFEVFVRPAILKMLGQAADNEKVVDAVLEEDIKRKRILDIS